MPWHWHTANERLIVVRGSAQVEMKGMPPQALTPGDFAALPAKHVHQFTALTEVEMFTLPDAAFDIHYVGQDASEISFADALKAVHEAPGSGK